MIKSVNQLLLERVREYFKEKYAVDLSLETAEEYLKSYAGLFAVIAKVEERRGRPVGAEALARHDGALLAHDAGVCPLGVSNT